MAGPLWLGLWKVLIYGEILVLLLGRGWVYLYNAMADCPIGLPANHQKADNDYHGYSHRYYKEANQGTPVDGYQGIWLLWRKRFNKTPIQLDIIIHPPKQIPLLEWGDRDSYNTVRDGQVPCCGWKIHGAETKQVSDWMGAHLKAPYVSP